MRMTSNKLVNSPFYHLGKRVTKHYKWIIGIWLVLFFTSLFFIPRFLNHLTPPQLYVEGSPSSKAEKLIQKEFNGEGTDQAFLVFHSNQWTMKDLEYAETINKTLDIIRSIRGVTGIISPLEDQPFIQARPYSKDFHTSYAILSIDGKGDELVKTIENIKKTTAVNTENLAIYLTGRSPTIQDLTDLEKRDLSYAEKLGMPLALLVLLIAFGSVIAALIPVIMGAVGVCVTFGLLGLSGYQEYDIIVPSVITMIGLGIGIDYSLFITMRYKEEILVHDKEEAVAIAISTSGKSIFYSGVTVILSLAGLPLVHAKLFLNLSISTFAILTVLIVLSLTLLPALLFVLGERIDLLALPFRRRMRKNGFSKMYSWTKLIMRKPYIFLVGSALLLVICSFPLFQIKLGINLGGEALNQYSSGKGNELLSRQFEPGLYSPLIVMVKTKHQHFTQQELDDVDDITNHLKKYNEVAYVTSITQIMDTMIGDHQLETLQEWLSVPEFKQQSKYIISPDLKATPILVTLKHKPDSEESAQFVMKLKKTFRDDIADEHIYLGGLTSQITDLHQEILKKTPWVIGVVLTISFLFLVIAFQSLLIPLKAILLNLVCVLAACGLSVGVFQMGWGEEWFRFTSPGFLQAYIPVLTFAILFGLSMDYEVFLVGRIKEEWEKSHNNTEATARGIEYTGPFITQAALIMIIVFTSFIFTHVLEIKQLGFTLAFAVFLDATIIRMILVPILMNLMGKWNWWLPNRLERWIRKLKIIHD